MALAAFITQLCALPWRNHGHQLKHWNFWNLYQHLLPRMNESQHSDCILIAYPVILAICLSVRYLSRTLNTYVEVSTRLSKVAWRVSIVMVFHRGVPSGKIIWTQKTPKTFLVDGPRRIRSSRSFLWISIKLSITIILCLCYIYI